MTSEKRLTTMGLITVPALITLAITLVRLAGERQGWSRLWFNPDPGGGFALIGIVWLVPIFGVYFAMKLAGAGEGPARTGRVLLLTLLSIVVIIAGFVLAIKVSQPGVPLAQAIVGVASITALAPPSTYKLSRPWISKFGSEIVSCTTSILSLLIKRTRNASSSGLLVLIIRMPALTTSGS